MNPNSEDKIENKLFHYAMGGKWDQVIKIYGENQSAHKAKITSSGDTALHVAIANDNLSVVKQLVDAVLKFKTPDSLEMENDLGNTPLHLAAYQGSKEMCKYIAKGGTRLVGKRNHDNETPIFVAARHGQKTAFEALHSLIRKDEAKNHYKGKEGETILHSAISGEYFDLAFYIINHFEELITVVNAQGFMPLHLLANKPTAFKSGSQIRGFQKLIYQCIFVDELQPKEMHFDESDLRQEEENKKYPQNYATCVETFSFFRLLTRVLLGRSDNSKVSQDEENIKGKKEAEIPKDDQPNKKHPNDLVNILKIAFCGSRNQDEKQNAGKKDEGSNERSAQGHEFLPKNYNTIFNIVKLLSKAMLVILGLGSKAVDKIREEKKKHVWSLQIMDKLLEKAAAFPYEYNGKSPTISTPGPGEQIPYTLPNSAGEVKFDPRMIDSIASDDGQAAAAAIKGDKKPCKECSELLRSLLNSLGLERHIANYEHNGKSPTASGAGAGAGDKKPCKECSDLLGSVLNSLGLGRQSVKGRSALEMEKKETPILVAAKSGVVEMVAEILKRIPVAIHDMNSDRKNMVLLAVEHRQPHVYRLLVDSEKRIDTIFRKTDKDGNSALHLAARLGENRPWLIPGAALQMQWEIKWYKFVKDSMPRQFFPMYNKNFETPMDIFRDTHEELVKNGGAWLTSTSESCSLVAALIATVAFATSATVPGGVKSDNSGIPSLQNEPAFSIFAISSLVALCFSITSVILFLSILTSRFQENDFGSYLPRQLLYGLTSLFVSIGAMLLSFCAGHYFVLKEKLQYSAFPIYAVVCLPVTFFAVAQFPLYFDLARAAFRKVPERSSKSFLYSIS